MVLNYLILWMMAKIYFCGSVRGGRELASSYRKIIRILEESAQVLTEHLGDDEAVSGKDARLSDREIHERDLEWLKESDLVVAEVTIPSLGVGYEIGRAIELGKPVLCLYREREGKRLSAMIAGSPQVQVIQYDEIDYLNKKLKEFIIRHAPGRTS